MRHTTVRYAINAVSCGPNWLACSSGNGASVIVPHSGTLPAMTAVFRDVGGDRRHLRHLMATRLAHGMARVQPARTVPAALRHEIHHRVHALDRHQLAMVTGMPRLPTRLASTLPAASALTLATGEAIGGWRFRGDRGILLLQRELPLQLVDLARLIRDLLRTLVKFASQLLVLAPQPLHFLRVTIPRASFTSSPLSLHRAERTKSLQKLQEKSCPVSEGLNCYLIAC